MEINYSYERFWLSLKEKTTTLPWFSYFQITC